MENELRIDSHKLLYHPEAVGKWLAGDIIYPITVELTPTSACNHRCVFCAFDYQNYQPVFLEKDIIVNNLKMLHERGTRAVVIAGEGEPLLHPDIISMVEELKSAGLDLAMSSNGVQLTREKTERILANFSWVRFSVSAADPDIYDSIHRGKKGDVLRAMENIAYAAEWKKKNNLPTTLGIQMLLIPENIEEVLPLARAAKKAGVDYFSVKPYSHHPKSLNNLPEGFSYTAFLEVEKELQSMNDNNFMIAFRANSMNRKEQKERSYTGCPGLPFWAFIAASGDVYGCSAFIGDEDFHYGNLHEKDIVDIWEGEPKLSIVSNAQNMNTGKCRELCRLDEMNSFLDRLRFPGHHDNFI